MRPPWPQRDIRLEEAIRILAWVLGDNYDAALAGTAGGGAGVSDPKKGEPMTLVEAIEVWNRVAVPALLSPLVPVVAWLAR
jgi:hypothetical protein